MRLDTARTATGIGSLLLVAGLGLPARTADPPRPSPAMIEAARRFAAIEADWEKAGRAYREALDRAKTKAERDGVTARLRPDPEPYVARCLRLFADRPDTWGGAAALYWIACNAPKSPHAGPALAKLKEGPLAGGDLGIVCGLFCLRADPRTPPARATAPLVYDRAAREPDHPKAADLLVWVCRVAAADDSAAGARLYRQAGDRLVARYPDARYMWRFCQTLQNAPDPEWAEGRLRAILAGADPANRLAAAAALAAVLQNKDAESQPEAERLYRRVIEEAAKVADEWNRAALRLPESVHLFPDGDRWASDAQAQLAEMRDRGLGKPAPDLSGADLDGEAMRLAEYRGKVVLLTFWASWCGPCLALVPDEKALAERLAGRPFAVVGVNGDETVAAARTAAARAGLPWRSFRDRAGDVARVSEAWAVAGWPTLYLIDHRGVIRKRWVGAPPAEVLRREAERLVAAAERDR